ncbi:MAG: hypothetical protein ACRC9K_18490 [Afipia sp.]
MADLSLHPTRETEPIEDFELLEPHAVIPAHTANRLSNHAYVTEKDTLTNRIGRHFARIKAN